jgi:hypothetical protein
MTIRFPRLIPISLALLEGCTVQESRTYPPPQPIIISSVKTEVPEENVSISPVDTGLEVSPKSQGISARPAVAPESPITTDESLSRPRDASSSPYPAGYDPNASQVLPTMDPVMTPTLPAISDAPSPEPEPARVQPSSAARQLFTMSAPAAVAALESDIEAKFKARNYGDVAAQLDRAIRIQPKNPELWHALAATRMRQNQPEMVEDLAKKSISLAKGNVDLIKSNWRLIAEARRSRGDGIGAQDALEKAW